MRVVLIFFFIWTHLLGQVNNETASQLFSKGETPEFLKDYNSRFYVPQSSPWLKGLKKDKKAFYLDQIYASNMIVFGDPVSQYCNDLLNEITSKDYSVYLIRSDAVATFSDSSNVFITIGLISRLSNEAQLLFHLTRELEVLEGEYQPLYEKTARKLSLENAINEVSNFSKEDNFELDKKAIERIKSKKLYSESEIISALDVLTFQNRPFYEYSFDISYFNNNHSYIPESKFFLIHKPNPQFYDYKAEFPQLESRISQFRNNSNSATKYTFLKSKEDFKTIVNIARHESVVISILKADFTEAIFEIYILEKLGNKSVFLEKLKAAAWWGLIHQETGIFKIKNYSSYEISDSKGAVFMRFLRMQTKTAKIALGLRILKDITDKYPESQAISRMFDDLISIAANSSEFKIESFYKTNLLSAIQLYNSKDSLSLKDDDLLDVNSQLENAKGVDSVNYHLFMIPDLVKNELFLEKYKSFKTEKSADIEKDPESLSIAEFSIVKYKGKKLSKIDNRQEIINEAYSIANNKTNISVSKMHSAESYNLNYLINSVYFQNYYYNDFKRKVQSPFSDELSRFFSSSKSEAVGVCVFEQAYEPTYRSFHLLGLLGITLPYIIPELFFSGNKSFYSSLYFNTSKGTTEGLVYHRINDPFNKYIIQHYFLESILITFPKDD